MAVAVSPKKRKVYNLVFYAVMILFTLAGIIYGNSIRNQFSNLRIWEYQNVLFLLLGVPFLFLQSEAKLPDFFEANITAKQRFIIPSLIGALFGLLDILVIKVIQHPQPYTELPPFLQPFPYSLFLYVSGAFEIEIFYRLIPLTIILLIGSRLAHGKFYSHFLWIGLILTSLIEPLEQMPDHGILLIIYSLISGFLMNFLQAFMYKKFGFVASFFLRLGHYLFWHILLGVYVQYVELQ